MKQTFSVIGQRINQLWFAYTIESLLGIEKDPKTYNYSSINDIKMLYQIRQTKKIYQVYVVICICSGQCKIRRTENRSGDIQGYKLKKRSAQWSKRKDFKVMKLKYMSKNYSHL